MELTWWVVVIVGFDLLAVCVAAALLRPKDRPRTELRRLANVGRLTRLPEYRREMRLRTISAVAAIVLLVVSFGAAMVAAARPTGLPAVVQQYGSAQPEDIMLCMGGPANDPAIDATLEYFSEYVRTFTTERIGLTTANRRVVPLTRDYEYAAGQFGRLAAAPDQPRSSADWMAPVSYVDYAGSVEDVLAMCMTGFPSFEGKAAQRRSLIYVGPGSRGARDESRPSLFTVDAVRDMASTGDVQINVVQAGSENDALNSLARATGGRSLSGDADMAANLTQIRDHPPAPRPDTSTVSQSTETPDIPLILALAALLGLALWPLAVRR
jgi:hypothetical protein